MIAQDHSTDIKAILSKRHDNGSDFWASADGRLGVGSPFTTLESPLILNDLGAPTSHEAIQGALQLILAAWKEDGRFRIAPSGGIYPCHTALAARSLCRLGFKKDPKLQKTLTHLFEIQHDDGGWRCKKFSGGRGPETEFSNPGVTLFALDAFRCTEHLNNNPALDRAVESLLDHWEVRKPIGPCHFGIGSRFLQVEYPFLRYNLFYYVYVLSFFNCAKKDKRFLQALNVLESKLDEEGRMIAEKPNRSLAKFSFCQKGQPSDVASQRYEEIQYNLSN